MVGALTALKVLVIAGVGVLAFAIGRGSASHFVPFLGARTAAPSISELAAALVGVFFSFGGFWEASRIASEVDRPARTLPWALGLGVTTISALYLLTTIAFIYLVPPAGFTSSTDFARLAGEALLGSSGPTILASIVVLSVMVSLLALLVMAPRVYVAMSDDGLFPRVLGSINPSTQTPVGATALTAVLATVLALLGNFQQIVAFFICTSLAFIALAAAALFVVRRRTPFLAFRVPGYPLTPGVFVLLTLVVIALVAANSPLQAGLGFLLVALGLPAYAVFVSRRPAAASVSEGASG
jgi:APA family basic amino acid/polyamine antiporter